MNIHHNIRACVLPPKHPGYRVPYDNRKTRMWQALDTKGRPGVSAKEYLPCQKKPEIIELSVQIRPIPAKSIEATGQVIKKNKNYQPTRLYSPVTRDTNSDYMAFNAVQALELIYNNHGAWVQGNKRTVFHGKQFDGFQLHLPKKNLIYRREYLVQKESLRQTQTKADDLYLYHLTGWSQGRLNTVGIFPYAGHYDPRQDLEESVQTFAYLATTRGTQTKLFICNLDQWRGIQIIPEQEGNRWRGHNHTFWNFPKDEKQLLSLAGVIQQGLVPLRVRWGDQEILYRSAFYHQSKQSGGMITITFLPF